MGSSHTCKYLPDITSDHIRGLMWVSGTLQSFMEKANHMIADDEDDREERIKILIDSIEGLDALAAHCHWAHEKLHDKDDEIEKLNQIICDLNTRCASLEAIVEADSESAAG